MKRTRTLTLKKTLWSRGAANPEDGEMEFGTTRFATNHVDASLDHGNREFE